MKSTIGFAAVQFDGWLTHVSGLGTTKAAAIRDANKLTDVQGELRAVPMTAAAEDAVKRLGGDAESNSVVTLALVTHAELKALEMFRDIERVILTAYVGQRN